MLHREAFVRIEISEECITSIIRVTRIGELRTELAVTSISSQRTSVASYANVVPSSPIRVILMMEAPP
jgi:hypothetical protein